MPRKDIQPSDFASIYPWNSIALNAETEIIAQNIMKVLERTGNKWRDLTWKEYKSERLQDGNFCEKVERDYFNYAVKFCKNADTAQLFSEKWQLLNRRV